jgi:hypothetical protein
MAENAGTFQNELLDLPSVLKAIEQKTLESRSKNDDSAKTIKDFRRLFDQDSSLMNRAIFNDAPSEEIHEQTLKTITMLVEILARTKKKNPAVK